MATDTKLHFERVRTPRIVSQFGRQIVVAIAIFVIVSYVAWQAWALFGPPRVTIISPTNGAHTTGAYIKFSGSAISGTSITLNGSPVSLNPDGSFSQDVPLKPGGNRLNIHAANHSGRTRDIVRIIYSDLT